ncbi:MAG TPA: cupredoxin domain-containing protein [Acidimicrobiales bacterium]|nr:cupredoxin domain-containing protein [Acidimicrobiales bacterium]
MSSRSLIRGSAVALVFAAACSGAGADQTVSFEAQDFAYTGLQVEAKAGDKVTFSMRNAGSADHEFEVFDPDGKALGEIEPVSAGKTGKFTLKLTKPGTYTFVCGVSDHEARGMQGTFEVR